jgi:hypothetical protein
MIDSPEEPECLRKIEALLEARGYWLAEDHRSESFGDVVREFVRRSALVHIVRDRGKWFVEMSGRGSDEWFSPMNWRDYLLGELGSLETPKLEDQCNILLRSLPAIELAIDTDPNVFSKLYDLGVRRAQAQGLPVTP